MADFPTLGLNFDLDALVAGIAQMARARSSMIALGDEAERTEQRITRAAAAAAQSTTAVPARRSAAGKTAPEQQADEVTKGASKAERQVQQAMESVAAAVEGSALTLVTKVDRQNERIRAAVQSLFAPAAFKGADRATIQSQLNAVFGAVEQSVEAAAVTLVTNVGNQALRIQAAMAGLIAPPPLGGTERARVQAALESVFAGVEQVVEERVVALDRYTQVQRARVAESLQQLLSPSNSSGAERSARQADLEAAFAGMEAQVAEQVTSLGRFNDVQRARVAASLQELLAPQGSTAAGRATRQAELEAAFSNLESQVTSEVSAFDRFAAQERARMQIALQNLTSPTGPLTGGARASKQGDLEAAFRQQTPLANAFGVAVGGVQSAIEKGQGALSGFGSALGGVGSALSKVRQLFVNAEFVVAAFVGGLIVAPLIHMADAMTALESRIALYSHSAAEVPSTFEAIYQAAQNARAPLEDFSKLMTRLLPIVSKFGGGTTDALRTAGTIAKSLAIQGATPQETSATTTQLTQALAGPRLYGQELRSLEHEAPTLLIAVAKAMAGIDKAATGTVSSFITLARSGKITSKELYEAINAASAGIDEQFKRIPPTIQQAMTEVLNSVTHTVGEINKGTGLGDAIAQQLQGFSAFLDKQSTINALVSGVQAVGQAFGAAATAAGLFAQYLPVILAAGGALAAGLGIQALVAWGEAALGDITAANLLAAAQLGAAEAAGILSTAFNALVSATPLIVLTAAAAAIGAIVKANNDYAGAAKTAADAQQAAGQSVLSLTELYGRYGLQNRDLIDTVNKLSGAQASGTGAANDNAKAQDAVTAAATARMNLELTRYELMLRSTVAEAQAKASSLDFSIALYQLNTTLDQAILGFDNFVLGIVRYLQLVPGAMGATAALAGQLATLDKAGTTKDMGESKKRTEDLLAYKKAVGETAAASQAALNTFMADRKAGRFVVKPPGAGTGKAEPEAPEKDKNKGLNGAINSLAKLREEAAGLNKEISAIIDRPGNPLGDLAARITKAGNEAAARYTVGKGADAGFASKFRDAAQAKEEATIRKGLVDAGEKEIEQANREQQALALTTRAREAGQHAMDSYYATGVQSIIGYATAMKTQHDADLQAKLDQSDLAEAQKYGVTSLNQIAAAYLASLPASLAATDAEKKHARELQGFIQGLAETKRGVIALTDAEAVRAQAGAAKIVREEEIADLRAYNAALLEGEDALARYALRKATLAAQKSAGTGGDPRAIANDVQTSAFLTAQNKEVERTREFGRQLEYAKLSADQAALEATAYDRAKVAMAGMRYASFDIALAAERTKAAAEQSALDWAKTTGQIKTDIRQSFIDTGKLDFKPLQEGLGKAIRQTIYDQLIAKPIDIVVNAVVNIAQQALQSMIQKIMGSADSSGASGFFGQVLAAFKGSPTGAAAQPGNEDIGDAATQLSSSASKIAGTTSKLASTIGKVAQVAGYAYAGYEVGNTFSQAVGIKQTTATQTGAAVGALGGAAIGFIFGGPIGAAIGSAIGTVIGNIAGSILGSKPTNAAAVLTLNNTGAVTSVGGDKRTAETTQAANQVASAVQQAETAIRAAGGTLGATVQSIDLGVRDTTHIILSNGQRLETAVGDAGAASTAALNALLQNTTFTNKALDTFVKGLESTGVAFADIITQIQAFAAAQKDQQSLPLQIEKYTDPSAYTLDTLRGQQIARRQTYAGYLAAGYITKDDYGKDQGLLTQLETGEINDALKNLASSADGAASSLSDIVDAQKKIGEYAAGLLTSANSNLSPTAQLSAAKDAYDQTLKAAQGGDVTALGKLTDAAGTYLDQAKSYYGSGGSYAGIFDQVYQELQTLSTAALTPPTDTGVSQTIEAQTKLLIDAINSGFDAVLGQTGAVPGGYGNGTGATTGTTGTGASGGSATGSVDWDAYLRANPDVAATATKEAGKDGFTTVEDYAAWHYAHYGQAEGRTVTTTGGTTSTSGGAPAGTGTAAATAAATGGGASAVNDNGGLTSAQVSGMIVGAIGEQTAAINDQLAALGGVTEQASSDSADTITRGVASALSSGSLRGGGSLTSLAG